MSILTDIGYRHSPSKINGWVNAPVKSIAEQSSILNQDQMINSSVVMSLKILLSIH